eukprot:tig00000025_g7912.t1
MHAALFASPAAAWSAAARHHSSSRLGGNSGEWRRAYSTGGEGGRKAGPSSNMHSTEDSHSGWQKASQQSYERNRATAAAVATVVILFIGLTYASVPLYKIFCQVTGFGGTTKEAGKLGARSVSELPDIQDLDKIPRIRIDFNADVSDKLPWSFVPAQKEIKIRPGETALAFYSARNNSDVPITGVATYNVQPQEAGPYFNKVQCFCFDEQRLKPGEEVDMPVFFFIDPDFLKDPRMGQVDRIMLSYTFFKAYDPDSPDEEIDEIPPDALRGPGHGHGAGLPPPPPPLPAS